VAGVNSPVAPVDLSQAIIGPGMAIFSKYKAVLEADGKPMTVRTALQLINRFFAEDDFDHDTQFCLHWFEQHGWAEGKYGEADVLARAKGTSVGGLQEAGVVESGSRQAATVALGSKCPRLGTRRPTIARQFGKPCTRLIRALNQEGEAAAGALLARMPDRAEPMRALGLSPLHPLRAQRLGRRGPRLQRVGDRRGPASSSPSAEAGIVGSQAQLDTFEPRDFDLGLR
jgi:putative DNA methylase